VTWRSTQASALLRCWLMLGRAPFCSKYLQQNINDNTDKKEN
jgi:hypothetical protein